MNSIHLLFGDEALPTGLIGVGAPKDHEAVLGLWELVVFLLGVVHWVATLLGKLLGLALLGEGATNVALHGGAVLEKMLRLSPWNGHGDSSAFSKCFGCTARPQG